MGRRTPVALLAAGALALAGCGGGERQDEDEAAGSYRLDVVSAEFPEDQHVAERTKMLIEVRNADTRVVPAVAVTVRTDPDNPGGAALAFGRRVDDPQLADPGRPVWIVDEAPAEAQVAHTNTWAIDDLAPGATATFEWEVTAVEPGTYEIGYEVWPGLDGKAQLDEASRGATGSFSVTIDDTPPDARVGEDGEVIRSDGEDDS